MDTKTQQQKLLEQFKRMPFYKVYDQWVDRIMANEYYYEARFSDEGELLSEDYFDEEAFKIAKDGSLVYAIECYYAQKADTEEEISASSIDTMIQIHRERHFYEPVVLGTLFCIMLMELEKCKKWSFSYLCSWEERIGDSFHELGMNHDWLQFYALMSKFIWRLSLPEKLSTPYAMKCWTNLQKEGFIDDTFQFTTKAKNYKYQRAIAHGFNIYAKCEYKYLEAHFRKATLRDNRQNVNADIRISKHEGRPGEAENLQVIENCFKKK